MIGIVLWWKGKGERSYKLKPLDKGTEYAKEHQQSTTPVCVQRIHSILPLGQIMWEDETRGSQPIMNLNIKLTYYFL